MAVDTMWSCVQDLRNSSSARESSLMPFVVRKEKRKAKKPESPSPPVERKVSFSMAHFVTGILKLAELMKRFVKYRWIRFRADTMVILSLR